MKQVIIIGDSIAMAYVSLLAAREVGPSSLRQPEGGDPGVGEQPPIDGSRQGLRRPVRPKPGLTAVADRWQGTADDGVPAPVIAVLREVPEELAQVTHPSCPCLSALRSAVGPGEAILSGAVAAQQP